MKLADKRSIWDQFQNTILRIALFIVHKRLQLLKVWFTDQGVAARFEGEEKASKGYRLSFEVSRNIKWYKLVGPKAGRGRDNHKNPNTSDKWRIWSTMLLERFIDKWTIERLPTGRSSNSNILIQIAKVGMSHGFVGEQTAGRVADQQFLQQISASWVQFGNHQQKIGVRMVQRKRFVVGQWGQTWPGLFGRSAE